MTDTLILTKENASFFQKNGLVFCKINGKESRVFLHLAFPYDKPDSFISALDKENSELGMIKSISDLDEESALAVKTELGRRYYAPKILRILKMKDKNGYAYWTVITDRGKQEFVVRDNFRNFFKIGDNSAVIYDMDGNRFMIESVSKLDKKSRRHIEIYL